MAQWDFEGKDVEFSWEDLAGTFWRLFYIYIIGTQDIMDNDVFGQLESFENKAME